MEILEPPRRVALVTDFGDAGPYTGQMQLRLAADAPGVPVVPLISDCVPFRPDLAAYLLPGLITRMPPQTLYLCVIDPGVGGARDILAAKVGESWLVAPDNGLLLPLLRRQGDARCFRIAWRPDGPISDSFHGRDLLAPLAAQMLAGRLPGATEVTCPELAGADWPAVWSGVCYVDRYGNLILGVPSVGVPAKALLTVGSRSIPYARTFCEVAAGSAFWYANAFGLIEIAVNQGRADQVLGLDAGDELPENEAA